jgi:hypothetical protein
MLTLRFSGRRPPRRGAIAAQVSLMLTVLLGVAALAVDVGIWMAERRHAQETADAAALAGALDLVSSFPDVATAKSTASTVGTANYTSTTHLTVTIKGPGDTPLQVSPSPETCWYVDGNGKLKTGYMEATVEWDQPRYFSGLFGSGNVPVKARAVAWATFGTESVNILVLNGGNTPAALKVHGSKSIMTLPGAIVVDSTSSSALTATGSGVAVVSQSEIDVVGGISGSNVYAPSQGSQANVNTGATPVPDPLASLAVPDPTKMTVQSSSPYTAPGGTTTINPGVYQGTYNPGNGKYTPAITVNSGSTLKLNPGIYYLEGGGLSVSGGGILDGTAGVMIYNGQTNGTSNNSVSVGSISISGGGVVKLNPMTAAQNASYTGISIFQDRTATAPLSISGGTGTDIEGAIYAAKAAATVTGGSNIVPGAAFITDTLDIGGSSNFSLPTSPIQIPVPTKTIVRLVE